MKRILHIIGMMDQAGAEMMLMNLYRNIDRSKFQFDFIAFEDRSGGFDEEIKALGGKVIPIVASSNLKRMRKLTRFLKKHPEYTIVHNHMLLNSVFSLLAEKRAGVRHRIIHSHNTANDSHRRFRWFYEKFAIPQINRLSTYKIACGVAAGHYLYPKAKEVKLLLNGVEAEKIANTHPGIKALETIGRYREDIKILQVGRLSTVKNPLFTLQIAAEFKKGFDSVHIYLVGQGELKEAIEQEIRIKGLEDYVSLLGLRNDVPELMAAADLLLMPSLHEGFPMVLVESQAIGLPALVSTNVSNEVDLGLDMVSFLRTDHNPKKWADTILSMNLTRKVPVEKRIDVLRRKGFDVKKNAKELEAIYSKMN